MSSFLRDLTLHPQTFDSDHFQSMSSLVHLASLSISYWEESRGLNALVPGAAWLTCCTALKRMSFCQRGQTLVFPPEGLGVLTGLTHLELDGFILMDVPADFAQLMRLKCLVLRNVSDPPGRRRRYLQNTWALTALRQLTELECTVQSYTTHLEASGGLKKLVLRVTEQRKNDVRFLLEFPSLSCT